MASKFMAITKHNSCSNENRYPKKTYDECVDAVHEHFLSYDFEVKDGKPFDPGNFDEDTKEGGFDCFSDVVMHNGKVAQYTHCDGDGPVGEIIELN